MKLFGTLKDLEDGDGDGEAMEVEHVGECWDWHGETETSLLLPASKSKLTAQFHN